jgi:flagellar basal body P-ring formation protein FlgA
MTILRMTIIASAASLIVGSSVLAQSISMPDMARPIEQPRGTAASMTTIEHTALRAEARPMRDLVLLSDLIDGVPASVAATPLFRAPRLGETGTIQAARIIEAAAALGVTGVDLGGLTQVVVSRQARRIHAAEIETAVAAKLRERAGIDPRGISLVFDGTPPSLIVPVEISSPVTVDDVNYDPRGRRLSATLAISAPDGSQRRPFRITAAVVETSEVTVLTRSLGRNDTINASDLTIERRPRESVPADALNETADAIGRITKRAMGPGSVLRGADITRPEVVARGEMVTIIYEMSGMTLTARGKTMEAGGVGDVVPVQNPQSKRTIQATVVSPGRVSVTSPTLNGRVASVQR